MSQKEEFRIVQYRITVCKPTEGRFGSPRVENNNLDTYPKKAPVRSINSRPVLDHSKKVSQPTELKHISSGYTLAIRGFTNANGQIFKILQCIELM